VQETEPVIRFIKYSTMNRILYTVMIEGRILSLGSSVDVKYSPEVKKRIKQYIKTQRKTSEILLGRSSLYFPTFERILGEKGLPDDLKYLSVVESGLKAAATSRSGAAGLLDTGYCCLQLWSWKYA